MHVEMPVLTQADPYYLISQLRAGVRVLLSVDSHRRAFISLNMR